MVVGNLVVSVNEFTGSSPAPTYLGEYQTNGTRRQILANVPAPGGTGVTTEEARDLVFDPVANAVYLYNGTFSPYLARYGVVAQTWTQQTFTGWSTVNNGSYGGIAKLGNGIYVSDMNTGGATPQGIVRFDLGGGATTRFATTIQPKDLTIGPNGILYALDGAGSPTNTLYKFDPLSGTSLGTVSIDFDDHRAVAALADGTFFTASWGGLIRHYSATGTLLGSLTAPGENFSDIDISATGQIALGTGFEGDVVLTTTTLTGFTKFRATDSTSGGTTFVAWVVPEPTALPMMMLGGGLLLAGLRRRPRALRG